MATTTAVRASRTWRDYLNVFITVLLIALVLWCAGVLIGWAAGKLPFWRGLPRIVHALVSIGLFIVALGTIRVSPAALFALVGIGTIVLVHALFLELAHRPRVYRVIDLTPIAIYTSAFYGLLAHVSRQQKRQSKETKSEGSPESPPATVESATTGAVANAAAALDDPARHEPFGPELAMRVAAALEDGYTVMYQHRDYCGTGLAHVGGCFVYAEVEDGILDDGQLPSRPPLATFADRQSFIAWLSAQSNESLSGKERDDPWYVDNQRVTRARLENLIARHMGGVRA